MKADISLDGRLTIRPETEIEAFALMRWWYMYTDDGAVLSMDVSRFDGSEHTDQREGVNDDGKVCQ